MNRGLRACAVITIAAAACAGACSGNGGGGGGGAKSSGGAGPAVKADPAAVFGGWTLTRIEGKAPEVPSGGRTPTMTVTADGKITGYGGVNRFTGTIDVPPLAEGKFTLGSVASTRMAGPPPAMALEDAYFAALNRAETYMTGADGLTLFDAKGEVLHFVHR